MKPPMAKNKDLRSYCIMPIEAVQDKRLHGTSAFTVLALLCTYTDMLGLTWVSQGRIAKDMGVSRQAVWRQIKKLKEYGYIKEGKALNKYQTTKSIRVNFKHAPEDIDEAKANLRAHEQINLDENRRQAANEMHHQATKNLEKIGRKPKVTPDIQPVDNSLGGATSEVAGGETPLGCTNEPYNDKGISNYSDEARQFCVMFLRSAESFGTPRIINDRDVDVMSTWIRNGLTREKWAKILQDHWKYCRDKHRDYARGIGYFTNPVERVTTRKARSYNQDAKSLFQKAVRSTRG